MKILFISKSYQPKVGGVEKHVISLSRLLKDKGYKVCVIAEKYKSSAKIEEILDGIKIIRFYYPKLKFLGLLYIWIWMFKYRNLIKRSDIVHIHDVFIWYLPFRFLYPQKPVYTTFHGWEGVFPIPKKNIIIRKLASSLSWKTICIGEYINKYYDVEGDVITYGAADLKSLSRKKGLNDLNSEAKTKIVYLGRLEGDTGLLVFLGVLKKLKNYTIDFCGDGPLRDECENYGKVRGFIDPKDYLVKADICFASGYLSILEAFQSKCLVVAAYHNQLKKDYYTLTPFAKWLICDNNPAKISEKINFYLNNSKETLKIKKEAYDWAKGQTWDRLVDLYLKTWNLA